MERKLGEKSIEDLREIAKHLNMEEYQRIVESAELDISLKESRDAIRGDPIDEWKASYVSNQSISDHMAFQKQNPNITNEQYE